MGSEANLPVTAVNAFARPWKVRFQPAVEKVSQSINHVMRISQVFSVGALSKILCFIERLEARVQGQYINLGSAQENEQFQTMIGQTMHERLDVSVSSPAEPIRSSSNGEFCISLLERLLFCEDPRSQRRVVESRAGPICPFI